MSGKSKSMGSSLRAYSHFITIGLVSYVFSIALPNMAIAAMLMLGNLSGSSNGFFFWASFIFELCDTMVEDVQKLTGFDRVMVYKFHDDNHGEVISEITRTDLEPYLGVHYHATDIPYAASFLFKLNRVRMIYDCRAQPVRIIQSKELEIPICLVYSTASFSSWMSLSVHEKHGVDCLVGDGNSC